jgi:DNA-binding IscR family transcriptional regulator
MKQGSQLSDVLHVLLHMAEGDGPTTSESLAKAMGTHPVALRRLMTGLREAGLVASAKGHGGGWVMSCPLERITLRDVHAALGAPGLVTLGFRDDRPQCLVAQAVNESLGAAVREAEAALLERLGTVTLAALSRDFHRRLARHRQSGGRGQHRLEEHLHGH